MRAIEVGELLGQSDASLVAKLVTVLGQIRRHSAGTIQVVVEHSVGRGCEGNLCHGPGRLVYCGAEQSWLGAKSG